MSLTQRIKEQGSLGITSKEYMMLKNPQFEGQTVPDKDGFYRMYFSRTYADGRIKYYHTTQNIIP